METEQRNLRSNEGYKGAAGSVFIYLCLGTCNDSTLQQMYTA